MWFFTAGSIANRWQKLNNFLNSEEKKIAAEIYEHVMKGRMKDNQHKL